MANIIPMAGLGTRFSQAGYLLPKPLIEVSGEPMILQVIKTLPQSDTWIFIVRKEHIEQYHIDVLIRSVLPNAIIVVDENPKGQAASCALALPHLLPDEPMFIAACDNSFVYDKGTYEALAADETIDAVVWTFTKHPSLSAKPESWGWIKLEEDARTIADISVKVPVSSAPFTDHAIVATFYFKRTADFKDAYERMTEEEYRIKNEFYVDAMPVFLKKLGKRSVIFDVDLYVGWGKPEDLYLYQEWEYKVRMNLDTENPEFAVWKKFINSL